MSGNSKRARSRRGFTLLEVLVAFVILGFVAGGCLQIWSTSPSTLRRIENRRLAVLSAESLLAQIGIEKPLQAGAWEGFTTEGVEWHLEIRPYSGDEPEATRTQEERPTKVWCYLVKIHTRLGRGRMNAEASLVTIKLGAGVP